MTAGLFQCILLLQFAFQNKITQTFHLEIKRSAETKPKRTKQLKALCRPPVLSFSSVTEDWWGGGGQAEVTKIQWALPLHTVH